MKNLNHVNQSKELNIPVELYSFLIKDTYSILIKGNPGTGKTSLCFAILKALKIKSNFSYLTTRVSPKSLFLQYPWMANHFKIKVKQLKSMSEKNNNISFFEDARLDEPESLFERITSQLMDARSPLIIIDSWDAVACFMDKESRLNNERVLQTWLERAGARLILVNEGLDVTPLDYLVDGLVTLDQHFLNNNSFERTLDLVKLRGTEINNHRYIFSLNEGMFKICTETSQNNI